ncbi:MAG TPA: divalent cation tolerance protein CutA [Methanocorpusculum sp.]|nr:divalent cation tolerance protein CutA [Methanocorpusculum sp.]
MHLRIKQKITKVVLPDNVYEIQESAFERCISITYITLPKSLRVIGKRAFCRCYNLAYVGIGDNVEEFDEECFGFCGKLKTLLLNEKACVINPSAFNNCSSLMELHVAEDNPNFTSIAGILYDKPVKKVIRCPENYNYDMVSLPDTVKEIGEWCFSHCMRLIDVILPRGLETVGAHAFQDSCNIASLTLADSIKNFDISAIDGWNDRQQIVMGSRFHPVLKYSIEQKLKELGAVNRAQLGYQFCLIKTAFESEEEAVKMAKMLLDNRLIVSGQIRKMRSLYIWEDELCNEGEIELTCFTESELYTEVEKFINAHHSYELCELICIPIMNISEGFGKWISDYTGKIRFDM